MLEEQTKPVANVAVHENLKPFPRVLLSIFVTICSLFFYVLFLYFTIDTTEGDGWIGLIVMAPIIAPPTAFFLFFISFFGANIFKNIYTGKLKIKFIPKGYKIWNNFLSKFLTFASLVFLSTVSLILLFPFVLSLTFFSLQLANQAVNQGDSLDDEYMNMFYKHQKEWEDYFYTEKKEKGCLGLFYEKNTNASKKQVNAAKQVCQNFYWSQRAISIHLDKGNKKYVELFLEMDADNEYFTREDKDCMGLFYEKNANANKTKIEVAETFCKFYQEYRDFTVGSKLFKDGVELIEDIPSLITKKPFDVYDIIVTKYGDAYQSSEEAEGQARENNEHTAPSEVFAIWDLKETKNYKVSLLLRFKGEGAYYANETPTFEIYLEDFTVSHIRENVREKEISNYLKMFGLEENSDYYSLDVSIREGDISFPEQGVMLFIDIFLK